MTVGLLQLKVGLLPDIFTFRPSTKLHFNWLEIENSNNYEQVQWGEKYKINTDDHSINLKLPLRFKKMIEKYIKKGKNEYLNGTTFLVILKNTDIIYFPKNVKSNLNKISNKNTNSDDNIDSHKIIWDCK